MLRRVIVHNPSPVFGQLSEARYFAGWGEARVSDKQPAYWTSDIGAAKRFDAIDELQVEIDLLKKFHPFTLTGVLTVATVQVHS